MSEIQHYGIVGMKWGVRRYQNKDGTLTKAGLKRYAKKERKQKYKDRRVLSDDELKKGIQRLQLEKQLKDLTKEDLYPGLRSTQKSLKSVGGEVVESVLKSMALYYLGSAIGGTSPNRSEMGSIISKGKKK